LKFILHQVTIVSSHPRCVDQIIAMSATATAMSQCIAKMARTMPTVVVSFIGWLL
jgi:hypothetical protein